MDYQQLVIRAWQMTWRQRFLWVFGLFAGGTTLSALGQGQRGGRAGSEGWMAMPPQSSPQLQELAFWAGQHQWVVVAGAAALVTIGLGLFAMVIISQGAMAEATTALASNRRMGFQAAWRGGLRLFWHYLGLWVTLALVAFVVAAVAAALIAAPLLGFGGPTGEAFGWRVGIVGVIVVIAAVALIGVAIVVPIVVAYAQRAIATEELYPFDALRFGWTTFRNHLGESLLTLLLAVALQAVSGIAVASLVVLSIGVFGGIGAGFYALAGAGPALLAYGVIATIGTVVLGLVATGICNTFFWAYWTLAFLQFSGPSSDLQSEPMPLRPDSEAAA